MKIIVTSLVFILFFTACSSFQPQQGGQPATTIQQDIPANTPEQVVITLRSFIPRFKNCALTPEYQGNHIWRVLVVCSQQDVTDLDYNEITGKLSGVPH